MFSHMLIQGYGCFESSRLDVPAWNGEEREQDAAGLVALAKEADPLCLCAAARSDTNPWGVLTMMYVSPFPVKYAN